MFVFVHEVPCPLSPQFLNTYTSRLQDFGETSKLGYMLMN